MTTQPIFQSAKWPQWATRILLAGCLLPLSAYSAQLEFKGSPLLAHEVGASTPYSGTDIQYYYDKDSGELSKQKLSEVTYLNGLKNGQAKYWAYDGSLQILRTFSNDILDGRAVSFYPNVKNSKAWERFYVNGKEEGLSTFWDTFGNKQAEMNMKQGMRHGLMQSWSDSQELTYRGDFNHDKQQGEHWWYYDNGHKQQRAGFNNGQYDGAYQVWYENGTMAVDAFYVKGKLQGEERYWYDNGQPQSVITYQDGVKQGKEQYWYKNGNLMHSTEYQAGLKQGKQETWYEDGQPQSVSHFNHGTLDGEELLWTKNGVKTTFEYQQGRVVQFDIP
ncbi:hypothetical protein OTK51_12105 [Vibrio scophthalmi]|uniref:Antitoxin YwqK n=1 Tax=Vibrio scophthalmi TaxID=45658 RepID=A0A1E3WH30_9VIBR|nr:toxin-antitoxin system YwqK family antitoxin [Vibrio scophthalmi]MCY9804170.1 hypothetical protein [Vibrio scophthalmi]ODS05115.1 hypothetical protein VSF3289_04256 [Vibrio scophthalmi]